MVGVAHRLGGGNSFTPLNLETDSHFGKWHTSHIGAALFVFGDGSVRPLRFGTDGDVVFALLTPAGGEIVNPDQ